MKTFTKLLLLLNILLVSTSYAAQNSPIEGFAQYAGTTGGAGGKVYTVTNCKSDTSSGGLKWAIAKTGPRIIHFTPGINCTIVWKTLTYINSDNITIDGAGANIIISGMSLDLFNTLNPNYDPGLPAHNIIVRNLKFYNTNVDRSAISIAAGSSKIWIDHCTFSNNAQPGDHVGQGITIWNYGDDYPFTGITLSWNHFIKPNAKSILIGRQYYDTPAIINVSVHHNFFDGVDARNVRIHGPGSLVHEWNNYVYAWTEYGAGASSGADIWAQNNYFEDNNNLAGNSHDAVNCSYGSPPVTATYFASDSCRTSGNFLGFSGTATQIPLISIGVQPTQPFNTNWIPYSYNLEVASTALKNELKTGTGANK